MQLPVNWRDQLEKLREEQRPSQHELPVLQLPAPPLEPPPGWEPRDKEPKSTVIIIDL
jgi:hypothetical protein